MASEETAKYRRVAAELRDQVYAGELVPGERLLTEQELADQNGLTRRMARAALGLLKMQGLVRSEHGSGWYVADRRRLEVRSPSRYAMGVEQGTGAFRAEARAQGFRPDVHTLQCRTLDPPAEFAARLELAPGEEAVVKERVLCLDDEAVWTFDSWHPSYIARGTSLARVESTGKGTTLTLAELGHAPVSVEDQLTSRGCTAREAELLGVRRDAAVLELFRTLRRADGAVVELRHGVARPDRVTFVYQEQPIDAMNGG